MKWTMEVQEDTSPKRDEEVTERESKRGGLDHPFSIESILNGTTKCKKLVNCVDVQDQKNSEEDDELPLNALEEFTSKTFSTMKSHRTSVKDEGNYQSKSS